jgi:hypothetical protein
MEQRKKMKKGQLNVLYSKHIIFVLIGGILGYLFSGNLGIDNNFGMIIGGVLGLILSLKI